MRQVAAILALCLALPTTSHAWGRRGHRIVHQLALEALDKDRRPEAKALAKFLEHHRVFFVENADLPDRSRHLNQGEAPDHFLDVEDFGGDTFLGALSAVRPSNVPDSAGRLPWSAADRAVALRRAIARGAAPEILREAVYLGHFIADAHVPLHSTRYFDGRTEEEKGIHARWESKTVNAMRDLDGVSIPARHVFISGVALTDSAFHDEVTFRMLRTLDGSHEYLPSLYQSDAESRRLDPTFGETYAKSMIRREGLAIRSRIAEAARCLADILAFVADSYIAVDELLFDDVRIDDSHVERREATVEFTIAITRTLPARTAGRAHSLRLSGMSGSKEPHFIAEIEVHPSLRVGHAVSLTIPIALSDLDPFHRITIELVPFDNLSPEDNVVMISRKEWL